MKESFVPTVTTLADLLGGRLGPSGWFHTVCLALFPCCERPRWSPIKEISANYILMFETSILLVSSCNHLFSRMVMGMLTFHVTQNISHAQIGISNWNVIRGLCLFWTSDWIYINELPKWHYNVSVSLWRWVINSCLLTFIRIILLLGWK